MAGQASAQQEFQLVFASFVDNREKFLLNRGEGNFTPTEEQFFGRVFNDPYLITWANVIAGQQLHWRHEISVQFIVRYQRLAVESVQLQRQPSILVTNADNTMMLFGYKFNTN